MNKEIAPWQRFETLEAEQKRVTAQLEAVTRRVEKLERDSVYLLSEIVSIHESDVELGKILQDLFAEIANIAATGEVK